MQKKGQALVEFVLILPVLLLIFTIMFDLGNVFYQKYRLENHLEYVLMQKNPNKIKQYIKDYNLVFEENEKIILKKEVVIITPGAGLIFAKPFYIETSGIRL